jgi:hypothetical protein
MDKQSENARGADPSFLLDGTTMALLNFEWVTRCPPRRWARAHGFELQPIGPPVAIVAGA